MRLNDLTGQKFGNLIALGKASKSKGHIRWECKCHCGNTVIVDGGNLRSGHTKTCGHCERYRFVNSDVVRCDLPNGDCFLIDATDYPEVSRHRWSLDEQGYVHTTIQGKHIKLHCFLLASKGSVVDHINGDRNDNRRSNLRICSAKENSRNQKLRSNNTTGYKGVSYDQRRKKYIASIAVDYKSKFLGYFSDPIEAALKYDQAAILLFGEYARPNFMEERMHEEVLELEQKRRHGAA